MAMASDKHNRGSTQAWDSAIGYRERPFRPPLHAPTHASDFDDCPEQAVAPLLRLVRRAPGCGLRGQAGALTALQHEFLEIADGQVEQLKGRISELLEYNRVEAGRLVLDNATNANGLWLDSVQCPTAGNRPRVTAELPLDG